MPLSLRRKLADGRMLEGAALEVYIPRRGGRAGRWAEDVFSQALWYAKLLPDRGGALAWDHAPLLAELVPADATMIFCPPASRVRKMRGFYFARELTVATCEAARKRAIEEGREPPILGLPLRWEQEEIAGAAAAKAIMHQGGQGRKLGRRAECNEILTGRQVTLIDDLWTSGATAAVTAEALYRAGAAGVSVVCLGMTERTENRPEHEQKIIKLRAAAKKR